MPSTWRKCLHGGIRDGKKVCVAIAAADELDAERKAINQPARVR